MYNFIEYSNSYWKLSESLYQFGIDQPYAISESESFKFKQSLRYYK